MFTLIILLTMVNNPAIMKSEVNGFETLAECSQERDRVLRLKNSGYSDNGMTIKDAFCIKKE